MMFLINKLMFEIVDSGGGSTPSNSEDAENKEGKTLEPKTRLEYFLNKIAESGGSGGGSGVEPIIVTINITGSSGSDYVGTWTGATWDELLNAFMHNVAGGVNPMTNSYFWFNNTSTVGNLPAVNYIGPGFSGSSTVTHFDLACMSDGTVRVFNR